MKASDDWVFKQDMDVVRTYAKSMGISTDDLTAERIFDEGYATWVRITQDDSKIPINN